LRFSAALGFKRTVFVEEHALVCDVLIDQEQTFVVGGDDEALFELAQRADVGREEFPV
jgi:hypothetical protein